jgi:hypothetical protein
MEDLSPCFTKNKTTFKTVVSFLSCLENICYQGLPKEGTDVTLEPVRVFTTSQAYWASFVSPVDGKPYELCLPFAHLNHSIEETHPTILLMMSHAWGRQEQGESLIVYFDKDKDSWVFTDGESFVITKENFGG